jgi:archaemetzincin
MVSQISSGERRVSWTIGAFKGCPSIEAMRIEIIPLGPVDERLLRVVAANAFALFHLPAQVGRGLGVPRSAYDTLRHQYNAAILLKEIEASLPLDAVKVVAITSIDLYVPIFSFVFGEARQGASLALVSTHRLVDASSATGPNPGDLFLRTVKVALHELGHLFDLHHCEDTHCLMHYTDSLATIDQTPLQFCRYCQADLRLEDRLIK